RPSAPRKGDPKARGRQESSDGGDADGSHDGWYEACPEPVAKAPCLTERVAETEGSGPGTRRNGQLWSGPARRTREGGNCGLIQGVKHVQENEQVGGGVGRADGERRGAGRTGRRG